MSILICARELSRYIEGKCPRKFGGKKFRICNNRRVFGRFKEVWRRR